MESIESSDLEEGEILEHDLSSLKDSLNNDKDGFQVENYVNVHLKKKLELYDQKTYCKRSNNNTMLDSISSSEEEFNAEVGRNNFISDGRHFNFYTKRKSRPREVQDRIMVNGSAEDIMCQIDQAICRKSHSYKRKKHKDIRYGWEKLYEKKCSNRHRSQEMISSHKISGKKKVIKSKAFSDNSESEGYLKNSLTRKKKSHHKKRKDRDSSDYYCSGHNVDKKNYNNVVKKPVNKIFRDFDEVRRALLEKLKQQENERKKISQVHQTSTSAVQETSISMDSSNSDTEHNKEFNNVLSNKNSDKSVDQKKNENLCLQMDNDEDLDLVQLRLIALASNRKQKNLNNFNQSFQKTEKTLSDKLKVTSLFEIQTESNEKETKEKEEEEEEDDDDDTDLNRYELLLRAEALKTALLKKHQKRLIKLKTLKLEKNSESHIVSSNAEIPSMESNVDQHYQKSENQEVENNNAQDFKLENDSMTDNFDKENDMEVIKDPINSLKDSEKIDNSDISSQPNESAKKKLHRTKYRKRKKKLSLCEDLREKHKNSQSLEEDCLTLRSQLLCDLIKKKTLKDTEKKSVLLDSAQISTSNNTYSNINKPERIIKPIKKFISSSKTTSKTISKIPKPEIQRIIVHLGSEESSEDEEILKGTQENKFFTTTIPNQDINVEPEAVKSTMPEELRASYERSVELLLSEARKKVEIEMGKAKNIEIATPEAVYKHLPFSQRLEYIKLKQKIAERERLRKLKKGVSNNGNSSNIKKVQNESIVAETKDNLTATTPKNNNKVISQQQNTNLINSAIEENSKTNGITSTTSVPTAAVISSENLNISNLKKVNDKTIASSSKFLRSNKLVTKEKNCLLGVKNNTIHSNASNIGKIIKKNTSIQNGSRSLFTNQSNSIRNSHNQILLSKLKLLLKKIKIEKTIEENYEKEISKLKNQLSLFEKKKSEQRFKIKKLAEESVNTYNTIQNMTGSKKPNSVEVKENKLNLKSEIKSDDATSTVKNDVSKQTVEKNDKNEITEVENIVENCDKKVDLSAEVLEVKGTEANELSQYNSPLEVFSQASINSKKVDPNVEICQFDLTGICRDEECTYQHLRPS